MEAQLEAEVVAVVDLLMMAVEGDAAQVLVRTTSCVVEEDHDVDEKKGRRDACENMDWHELADHFLRGFRWEGCYCLNKPLPNGDCTHCQEAVIEHLGEVVVDKAVEEHDGSPYDEEAGVVVLQEAQRMGHVHYIHDETVRRYQKVVLVLVGKDELDQQNWYLALS